MSLDNIDHIVVLVMENRSFDHLLGYRSQPSHVPGSGTLLTNPRFAPGPHHTYDHVATQLAVDATGIPTMTGFEADYSTVPGVSKPSMVTGYYDSSTLPVYDFFADHFTVADRWFSSVPGPTIPNRCFLLAGHSDGIVDNAHLAMHLLTHRVETLFDHLSANDVPWHYYYHDVPFLRLFKQFTLSLSHIRRMKQFYADVAAGTLPSVSWIDPNFTVQGALGLPDGANDDHPPADITRGQELARSIYSALRSNSQVWDKTLFIVTYDEHGGFYDHVPPPIYPDRSPFSNRKFERWGVRVPTFLISPWVARGETLGNLIDSTSTSGAKLDVDFDHTSISKTIFDRFCRGADLHAMGERLLTARSLRGAIQPQARDDAPISAPVVPVSTDDRVVGGVSESPVALTADAAGDFHHLINALGAHTAKTRRAPV